MYDIRELRAITGLSQSKFAAEFDVPMKTLQHWEQGDRKPPDYVLLMIYQLMFFKGLVKENKDMYKNITLPQGVENKSISELTEYTLSDWANTYPNKCGMFLLNKEDNTKGKLILQSSVRAYDTLIERKNNIYEDDPDIVVIKGTN